MPEWLKDWWPALAGVWLLTLGGFFAWVKWSLKHGFVTAEKLEMVKAGVTADVERAEAAIVELARQVDRHEQAIDMLPSRDQFHTLDIQLTSLGGKLDTTNARLDRVDRIADRLEAWHLNGSSR